MENLTSLISEIRAIIEEIKEFFESFVAKVHEFADGFGKHWNFEDAEYDDAE